MKDAATMKAELKKLIDTAAGRIPADLVIKNCKVVNVFSGKIQEGDIAFSGDQIAGIGEYEGKEVIDAEGRYAAPGFIDSHIHIESSYVCPEEIGRLLVPHGGTTIMADPHEIVNVCGIAGLDYMMKAAENTVLDVKYELPSCVPATPWEHSGAVIDAEAMKEPITREGIAGLGEFMNFPGVINAADSDLEYVKDKGTLVVGITDFEPMDYKDDNGNWIGFDADMASAFAEELGVDVEFVEIDWDNKVLELDGKSIDCVWNGMTLTDEVTSSMECTDAYLNNAQVVVVPAEKADKYQDTDSLKDLSFAVEAGSAGEKQVSNLNLNYTPVNAQADALMEVAAGTSDAAVIDSLMAAAMIGKGTGYADLTYTVSLNSEEYGVGFRKGSDLAAELNKFFEKSMKNGTMKTCAEKYKVQAALIEE